MIKYYISFITWHILKFSTKFKYNVLFSIVQIVNFTKEEFVINYKINFKPVYTFLKNLFKLIFKYKLKRKLKRKIKSKVVSVFIYSLFIFFYIFSVYLIINDDYFFTDSLLKWFILFEKKWEFLGHQSRLGLSTEETNSKALGVDRIERHSATIY